MKAPQSGTNWQQPESRRRYSAHIVFAGRLSTLFSLAVRWFFAVYRFVYLPHTTYISPHQSALNSTVYAASACGYAIAVVISLSFFAVLGFLYNSRHRCVKIARKTSRSACVAYANFIIITITVIICIIFIFYTLGIKDPEGFGKKWKKIVGVTITPVSHQTQRNRVAARRWIAVLARKRAETKKAVSRSSQGWWLFRLDALALSVIATATWLAGWVAGWLAVCHSGIVSKRLNVSENFFDHLIAPS